MTFDDYFFKFALPCLNSLKTNFPDHPHIKILYPGSNSEILNYISSLPNTSLLNRELDLSKFDGLNQGNVGSPMAYARYFLWSDAFEEFNNVLYIDCDTIIIKPFPEIFEKDDFFVITDNSVEGVFNQRPNEGTENLVLELKKDGLTLQDVDSNMVNSGFMLIPRKYRKKAELAELWKITRTYNPYIANCDQSIISIWCRKKGIIGSRDFRYNFQIHFIFSGVLESVDTSSIKVLHYAFWKPEGNFDNILLPALNFALDSRKLFSVYSAK